MPDATDPVTTVTRVGGESPSPAGRVVLLASVFAVAACGLVYELIAGAVSSYLLGDAVTQFSLVIGVFLAAMGIGSFTAKLIRHNLLAVFVELEIWIGLVGGTSSILLFAVNAFLEPLFAVIFYSLCATLGILIGVEIPLLVRILRRGEGVSAAISHVLALDYLGALVGSILFPLVILPLLGLSRASVVFGLMNLGVAAAGLCLVGQRSRWAWPRLLVASALLIAAFFGSSQLVGFLEDRLYQDEVVLVRDTPYQHLVITRWRDDIRLFINGHIQFSSIDEARYHEALVVPAMAAAGRGAGAGTGYQTKSVLILGGGDGLAVREVLRHAAVEQVTLVDIDPVMTELARTRPELVLLNQGALDSPKVRIINRDALQFLRDDHGFYQVVIIDLPDPSSISLARLYSRSFYALVARRLAAGGVMVTQATSPYFGRAAFWCIVATVGSAVDTGDTGLPGLVALPYHVLVPSFGDWGFVLAAHFPVDPDSLSVSVPCRFLTTEVLRGMFAFGADMGPMPVSANGLDDPVLYEYYKSGWQRFNE